MAKRLGLGRTQVLIENLKRELDLNGGSLNALSGLAGQVAATVTAAGTAAALSEALICLVDSGGNTDKVKMFNASYAGQIVIIINVDDTHDAVIQNVAADENILTLGEGKGCILVSASTGDNWFPVAHVN